MILFRAILALLVLPVAVVWAGPMRKLALSLGPVDHRLRPGCLRWAERGKIASIEVETGLPRVVCAERVPLKKWRNRDILTKGSLPNLQFYAASPHLQAAPLGPTFP